MPKEYQYHLTEIFYRNFRTNGKCSSIAVLDITCLCMLSFILKDFSQTEQNQLMSTPQEQNVDWETGRMLNISIGFQTIKFHSFLPPPPPPHFYCFPSTTTATTFLLFSLYHHHHHISIVFLHQHHISIVFPPPTPPPHFYCFVSFSYSLIFFLHEIL